MSTPVVWFEVMGQHGDNLQGFYAGAPRLALRPDQALRRVPAPRARRAQRGGPSGAARRPRPSPPWWVTFYTRVPDLDAAIAKARALGSQVLVPPTRHGDTVIAVVSDPEGHPVGLCT